MNINEIIPPDVLAVALEGRYVYASDHPEAMLRIWNYSQRAQFDNVWNEATTTCRGLITTANGEIVARPFRKFFNLGQMETIPDGPFEASAKMDGSLGIAYRGPDGWPAVATRGSFVSDQARWATDWLRHNKARMHEVMQAIDDGITWLFEIIYPANRIVVDYGDRAELVLLAAINNDTGNDMDPELEPWGGARAARFSGYDIDAIMAMEEPNSEGFVLQWVDGTRAKVKFAEYLRLHKLLTGVNARTIWELLSTGQSLDALVELVPDEFYDWLNGVAEGLFDAYLNVEGEARETLRMVDRNAPRAEQARIITASKYPGIVFAMLDDKNPGEKIWRLVKPEASPPFRCDDGAA